MDDRIATGPRPDAPAWRPLVLRTSGNVTEAIYGLILATSVIAVSREYESTDAGLIGLSVLVTAVVFWLAHVYARTLGIGLSHHAGPTRSQTRDLLRHDWPIVEVTIPLLLLLALGAVGVVADRTAVLVAMLSALAELAATGAYAARVQGAGIAATILSAAVAAGLGAAVVLLKVLVH